MKNQAIPDRQTDRVRVFAIVQAGRVSLSHFAAQFCKSRASPTGEFSVGVGAFFAVKKGVKSEL